MRRKIYLLCTIIIQLFLFSLPKNGLACSCGMGRTSAALGAFENADQVIIAKLTSIDQKVVREPQRVETASNVWSVRGPGETQKIFTLTVEKTYKGDLASGDEIKFIRSSNGTDCEYIFTENIGERHLFYLNKPVGNPPQYQINRCGRSARIEDAASTAAADILYLDNRSEVQGKNRLSGRLLSRVPGAPDFGGRKIKIMPNLIPPPPPETSRSPQPVPSFGVFEIITNPDGVFDIYDIPPGPYVMEIESPDGWKPNMRMIAGGNNEKIFLRMEAHIHDEVNIHFFPDNAIRGRFLDVSGQPIKESIIKAMCIDDGIIFYDYTGSLTSRTNENGEFNLTGMPEGDYVLMASPNGGITPDNPFKTPYYQGAKDSQSAKVFHMSPKVFFDDIIMQTEIKEDDADISQKRTEKE